MRHFVLIAIGVFSFTLIDLAITRKKISGAAAAEQISQDWSETKKRVKRARKTRQNKKRRKRRGPKTLQKYALKGTNSKDPRQSNQKAIRRMFRNS